MAVVAFLASVALKTPVTTKSSSLTAAAAAIGGVLVTPLDGVRAVWAERAEAESEKSIAEGRRSEQLRERVSMGCAMGLDTVDDFRSVVKSDH
jgi:hypothetical protein